jgi:hypothetical protein
LGDQVKKNEIGGACTGGEEKCIQGFRGESWGKRSLGKPRHRWGNNIKIDLEEVGWGHGLD